MTSCSYHKSMHNARQYIRVKNANNRCEIVAYSNKSEMYLEIDGRQGHERRFTHLVLCVSEHVIRAAAEILQCLGCQMA